MRVVPDAGPVVVDGLQNGVVAAGHAVVTALAVSGTGVITGTMAAGTCWVVDAGTGLLVRRLVPSGAFTLTPATLPAAAAFAVVGVDISTGSGTPVLAASAKGADQTTAALALSNSPATAAGRVRLLDVVITNTAGTYSLSGSRDRRPWARGAFVSMSTAADIGAGVAAVHTAWGAPFTQRLELTGVPFVIEAFWVQTHSALAVSLNHSHLYDGVEGSTSTAILTPGANTAAAYPYRHVRAAPVPGSHLVALSYYNPSGTLTMKGSTAGFSSVCVFREVVAQNASNGTA